MGGKILKKEDLNKFLYKIKTKYDLVAPVVDDIVRFEKISFISQINLEKRPVFSAKNFLMSPTQTLFNYKDSRIIPEKENTSQILFGLRLCDISAINALDKLFFNVDSRYTKIRENTILIGIFCAKEMQKECFCSSMDQKNIADLFFYDIGESYYIEVGTDKGLKLVSRLKDYEYETDTTKTTKKLKRINLESHYDSPTWETVAKYCISCGICTSVCPTCLCYNLSDKPSLDAGTGKKIRQHSSCQYDGFWKDKDKVPIIKDKTFKLKHRIYHKLDYFRKNKGVDMCTGCGRCISMCPAKIDFVDVINNMK